MAYTKIKNQAQQFLSNYKSDNPATFAAAHQAIGGLLILDGLTGIDNPFGGKKRKGVLGSLGGVIVGIVFIFGFNFILGLMGVNRLTETTTATVISVNQSDGSCYAQAKYTVGGKDYTQNSSMGSSGLCSLSAGQTTEINYNPAKPGEWAHDITVIKTVMKIFFFVGVIAIVTSLVTFAIRLLSIIFGWKLLKRGRALAKTLPEGTDLSTIKKEITQNFSKSVFGMGGKTAGTTSTSSSLVTDQTASLPDNARAPIQTQSSAAEMGPEDEAGLSDESGNSDHNTPKSA